MIKKVNLAFLSLLTVFSFFTFNGLAEDFGGSFQDFGPNQAFQIWVSDPNGYYGTTASPPTVQSALMDIAQGNIASPSIVTPYWKSYSNQTGLTGDKTGSFKIDTTGTLGAGAITGTSLSAGSGTITGGAITGTSFIIGANTLNTSEWSFLDGINQTVATTSSPTFVGLTLSGLATTRSILFNSSDVVSEDSKFTYSTANTLTLNTGQLAMTGTAGTTGATPTDAVDVLSLTGGNGGAGANTTTAGGTGSNVVITLGNGGNGSSGGTWYSNSGRGGGFTLTTGTGGISVDGMTSGTGGDFSVVGGTGGGASGGTAGRGANISFVAGLGGTSSGATGGLGGGVSFLSGTGGGAPGGGLAGGVMTFTSGTGGDGNGAAGAGGNMTMAAGSGGNVIFTSNSSGTGGSFTLSGGKGGNGGEYPGATGNGANGGTAAFTGGVGGLCGTAGSGTSGTGGHLYMYGGIGGAARGGGTAGANGDLYIGITSGGTVIGNTLFGNKITKYNNITTVSNGVPSELATVDLTGQTAAKSATTIYTPAASGLFRISITLQVTTAATTSSVLGGATGVTITYTEVDGSVAQSIKPLLTSEAGAVVVPATGNIGNATTTQSQGSCVIYAKTGVAVQYAIGYTSVGAQAMNFAAHLKLEAL